MPIVAVFQSPTLTEATYTAVVRRLTGGKKSRMDSPADFATGGVLAHVAGNGANGFRVVDVFESEDAFRRFGEVLMPILKEVGIEGAPDIYPSHAFVTA